MLFDLTLHIFERMALIAIGKTIIASFPVEHISLDVGQQEVKTV